MMATILDGRKIRDEFIPELKKSFAELPFSPVLTIIQVGDRADTNAYVKAKKSFADKIGIKVNHIQAPESISESELIDIVREQNSDEAVRGIIVQLPLPPKINKDAVIDIISKSKDVDAITASSIKDWFDGREGFLLPATARGIRTMLEYYKIDLCGKKVVVIGRSILVGKPVSAMCLNGDATVTVCHSKTPDLARETKDADIIVVATGKAGLIDSRHVKAGQVIIDVGINTAEGQKLDEEISKRKIVGDVDFESVADKVGAITPVPGGVGPLTVLSIFQNLLDLCRE